MYVTAHRVRRAETQHTAVHVYVHMHENHDVFAGDVPDKVLLRRVTEAEPGRLIAKRLKLPAGGNTVLSYLDVIAPDSTPKTEIDAALQGFRDAIDANTLPHYQRFGGVLVSFGAVFGLQGVEVREFDALRLELRSVLDSIHSTSDA
ncbi:MAG: hypothetical protein ACI9OJ_002442 [Myxococcota bacterium]|jgi:hypothetical protein